MNVRVGIVGLIVVGLGLSAIAVPALAAEPKSKMLVAPGEPYGLPKFGFSSTTIPGVGERIESVRFGSRAARLGLERGDVILSLNGYRLTYRGAWNDALSRALYDGGLVKLRVRDVRTGDTRMRVTRIDFGSPVEHYSKPLLTIGSHLSVSSDGLVLAK